jgi:hypothetical protein
VQIVPDNYLYARVALVVKDKGTLSEEKLPELAEVLADEAKAKEVSRALLCCFVPVCVRQMHFKRCILVLQVFQVCKPVLAHAVHCAVDAPIL